MVLYDQRANSIIETYCSTTANTGIMSATNRVCLEGFNFVPQDLNTEKALESWVYHTFPHFSKEEVTKVLDHYPLRSPNAYIGTQYLTSRTLATGNQERANLIYGESTFPYPSYWLAEAYDTYRGKDYKMQFSVPSGLHDYDDIAFFGNNVLPNHGLN